jgi:pyruvate/oxaloacetate carboxyltransferase
MGLANVLASIDAGADRFGASVGGIGGCPYAPGATGNVCTEEIVHALELMGYDTGVDLAQLVAAAQEIMVLGLAELVAVERLTRLQMRIPERQIPAEGEEANYCHQAVERQLRVQVDPVLSS